VHPSGLLIREVFFAEESLDPEFVSDFRALEPDGAPS
jgi:hypothetical protein